MQIILETPLLYLREFTATDALLILALNKDPEVLKYVHELPLQTIEDAEKILINNILPQYSIYKLGRLAIHLKENEKGALIEEVQKETAAEKAGLKKDDIIIKVDNKKIANPSELDEAISSKKPNDEVEITYLRDGKEQKTKAKLGESKFPGGIGMHEFKMGDGFPFGNH